MEKSASSQVFEIREFWGRLRELDIQEIILIEVLSLFAQLGGKLPIARSIYKMLASIVVVLKPSESLEHVLPPCPKTTIGEIQVIFVLFCFRFQYLT